MPIYNYRCLRCGYRFERLIRRGEQVACPECGHTELKRLMGTFGVKNPGKYLDLKKMHRIADQRKRQQFG